MRRWLLAILCLGGSLAAVLLGLLVPAHLRAVDKGVLARAGANSHGVLDHAIELLNAGHHGAAQILVDAATSCGITNTGHLDAGLQALSLRDPRIVAWGMPDSRLEALFWADQRLTNAYPQPLCDIVVRLENRGKVLSYLRVSPRPVIQELLRTRALTNTVLFPPSTSASGQAYDAAVAVCGMLLDRGQISPKLSDWVHALATRANEGEPERLEELLMNLLAMGQRMNFGQLIVLLQQVDDAETLQRLAQLSRTWDRDLPLLFAMVRMSGKPAEVANHALKHAASARNDFRQVLPLRAAAVKELLKREQRLYAPSALQWAETSRFTSGFVREAAEYVWLMPWVALGAKALLYFSGGFLLALALHHARRPPDDLERPLQVRKLHMAREALFGMGSLLFLILLSEPFLTEQPQKPEPQIRLRLPSASAIVTGGTPMIQSFMMTQSLLTLLLFFVLQALLYTGCLVKLAEIRRQQLPASTKLKLLDNEDHLFDAGLYLGFAGTIISLILVSMGVAAPSLMAAYSSTSFGIIFVSLFKICNLRPLRRRLLMEAESVGRRGAVDDQETWATQS